MIGALPHRLLRDGRGATILEFAIILPVMMLAIMGLSDLCYRIYVQSVLSGAIQKAGRDSAIEGGAAAAATIDAKVEAAVQRLAPSAQFDVTRTSYATFSNVGPEPFNDDNHNNRYDAATECFSDVNGNHVWDADPGTTGQGNANDVTVYQIAVTYPRLFPIARMIGWSDNQQISARTVLKNQPYNTQNTTAVQTVCP